MFPRRCVGWIGRGERTGYPGALFRRLRQIEIEFGPARAGERPFMFVAPFEGIAALVETVPIISV